MLNKPADVYAFVIPARPESTTRLATEIDCTPSEATLYEHYKPLLLLWAATCFPPERLAYYRRFAR